MSDKKLSIEYARMLTRVSPEWSVWDEYTQWRHTRKDLFEFKRSRPYCMLAGIGLIAFGLERVFGLIFLDPAQSLGVISILAGMLIFPIGYGVIIDGMTRKISRWWGWIPKPLYRKAEDFSEYRAIELTLKLGPKAGEHNVGRTVRRPLYLVRNSGKRILLKPCRWRDGAVKLAEELCAITKLSFEDNTPEGDSDF